MQEPACYVQKMKNGYKFIEQNINEIKIDEFPGREMPNSVIPVFLVDRGDNIVDVKFQGIASKLKLKQEMNDFKS